MFVLPNLPVEAYDAVQTLRAKYEISQWQVILVAIANLMGTPDATVGAMVAQIKSQYTKAPNPWVKVDAKRKAAREAKKAQQAE